MVEEAGVLAKSNRLRYRVSNCIYKIQIYIEKDYMEIMFTKKQAEAIESTEEFVRDWHNFFKILVREVNK